MHVPVSQFAGTRVARGCVAVILIVICIAPPGRALQFTLGPVKGSFDSTISLGGLYRLKNPDPDFYGASNPSRALQADRLR